jgi:hypothetical protein
MGEIVDDQMANQAAKPLTSEEKKRKKNHQFWNS